jgi:hypothetical protein
VKAERISSLFWFVLGASAAYGGFELGLGSAGEPGSGFLTFIAGVFVAFLAGILFIQSLLGNPDDQVRVAALWRGLKWYRALIIVFLIIAFILAFETIGFLICSFFLLVIIMHWLEGLAWKISLLVPALTVLATYVLFTTILKTALPTGVLGI